jgi:hypothetical protein
MYSKALRLSLLSILIGVFLSSCNEVTFPPPSTVSQPLLISIGALGTYGFCMEDFEDVEDVILDITVNSVNTNSIVIDEFDFRREMLGNNILDLFGSYEVLAPRTGLFTVQVSATFSCSSCCSGNGPEPTSEDPDAVTCGSNGGVQVAGQPRFSIVVPAMDAALLNGGIQAFPTFRGCSTCGCVD